MTEEEKGQLRVAMEKKKSELFEPIADLKEATKPMGLDSAIGRVSRMDYINNKSIDESSLRKAEKDLKTLERWLELYETSKFGKCIRCGNEININRLLLCRKATGVLTAPESFRPLFYFCFVIIAVMQYGTCYQIVGVASVSQQQ